MLPNVQKEEMEQGETGVKPTGMDIRGEEELEAAGEGFGHKGMTHSEKLSDWDPVDRIRMEEEFKTPPRKGDQRKWTGFQTDGSRDKIFDLGLVPDYVAAQSMSLTDQNQPGNTLSPVVNLEETVLRIKRDMEDLQTENKFLRTRRIPGPVPLVRQAALTTTKVPWFNGSTSWEQYQQVFDAIALSNG